MRYRRFASAMLCLAVLALASATVLAATDGVTTADNGRTTIVTAPAGYAPPDPDNHPNLRLLFSNFANKYPKGVYWCCTGGTISGPFSVIGTEYWEAAGFVADADALVKRVRVGVGYVTGATTSLVMTLNEDNGGVPGAVLIRWEMTNMPQFGSCCTFKGKKDKDGQAITGGKLYWVVLKTQSDSDIWAAWNLNDADQITPIPTAFAQNGVWSGYMGFPGFAFEVAGK